MQLTIAILIWTLTYTPVRTPHYFFPRTEDIYEEPVQSRMKELRSENPEYEITVTTRTQNITIVLPEEFYFRSKQACLKKEEERARYLSGLQPGTTVTVRTWDCE